jgi:restriction endonuclease S subunit
LKTTLKEISSIQTGVFAKPNTDGDIVYLQARHFDEDGKLNLELHPDLNKLDIKAKHLLLPGDILYAAKGAKNFAALYESKNIPAVASTSFFVIRINKLDENIMPAYLVWFMNHPDTQFILKNQARGSSIASISKVVLEELEIPIPTLKMQQLILNIASLREKEKGLKTKIENLREKQIQQQIIQALK